MNTARPPLVSVVIPSRHGAALLAKHLPETLAQTRALAGGGEIVVVDDASERDAGEDVALALGADVRFVRAPRHGGFGTTCNLGAREARGTWLFFLNTDMHLEPGCLAALLAHAEPRDDLFAVSPVIWNKPERFVESTTAIVFRRGVFDVDLPGRRGLPPPEPGTARTIAYACGGALLCRREVFLGLGGFSPLLTLFYWEDAELGLRARRLGLACEEVGAARTIHDHAQTVGSLYTRDQVKAIFERNRMVFTWLHAAWPGQVALHALWAPIRYVAAALRRDPGARGMRDAWRCLAEVRAARRQLPGRNPR